MLKQARNWWCGNSTLTLSHHPCTVPFWARYLSIWPENWSYSPTVQTKSALWRSREFTVSGTLLSCRRVWRGYWLLLLNKKSLNAEEWKCSLVTPDPWLLTSQLLSYFTVQHSTNGFWEYFSSLTDLNNSSHSFGCSRRNCTAILSVSFQILAPA